MADYQQINDPMTGTLSEVVLRRADNAYIPNDPANRDRQEYEEWLGWGNEPDPPDPLPKPAPPGPTVEELLQRIAALEARVK